MIFAGDWESVGHEQCKDMILAWMRGEAIEMPGHEGHYLIRDIDVQMGKHIRAEVELVPPHGLVETPRNDP